MAHKYMLIVKGKRGRESENDLTYLTMAHDICGRGDMGPDEKFYCIYSEIPLDQKRMSGRYPSLGLKLIEMRC